MQKFTEKSTRKLNQATYKKNYMPQPSGINSRNARLVQHLKIN